MLVLLSPSKTMAFEDDVTYSEYTMPPFKDEALPLIEQLRQYAPEDVAGLMNINDKLARLNFDRFQQYDPQFHNNHTRQALLAYRGDVYDGIPVSQYGKQEFDFAQQTVRILSGLYGILRPLDLIQPYRLEMSTKLPNPSGNSLYDYWREALTHYLNETLKQEAHEAVVNLASNEYFKAIDANKLEKPVITPVFKENKNGTYKTIAIYAKKARGMMTDFIIRNQVTKPAHLKGFDEAGYCYQASMSSDRELVFVR